MQCANRPSGLDTLRPSGLAESIQTELQAWSIHCVKVGVAWELVHLGVHCRWMEREAFIPLTLRCVSQTLEGSIFTLVGR